MRVTYDSQADAVYILLREVEDGGVKHVVHPADTEPGPDITLDFDAEYRLVGIEVIGARRGLPPAFLDEAERV